MTDEPDEPTCDCQPSEWCDECGTDDDWRLHHGELREDR